MAQIINAYVKLEVLEQVVAALKAKNEKGFGFTIAVNDEARNYGQNVSSYANQTKEQREAKKEKFWFANGKTVWSDKGEFVPPKEGEAVTPQGESESPLPF